MASFQHRGRGHYGLVVHSPKICGDRYVYFTKGGKNVNAWVIRDFVANKELRHENAKSGVNINQIEATFILENSMDAPRLNVEIPKERDEFIQFLKDKSIEKFGKLDTFPPDFSDEYGSWSDITATDEDA